MNFTDWYTDTMEIYRVTPTTTGNLTSNQRQQVASSIPCRIYHSDQKPLDMSQTAASYNLTDKLMCANSVDIRAGDELLIQRGGRLGKTTETIRAFAGDSTRYFEPFGAVIPGLAHQEIPLLRQERVVLHDAETAGGAAAQA